MSARSFLILLALSVVAIAGAAWTVAVQQGAASGAGSVPQTLFPALEAEGAAVDGLSIERAAYSIELSRQGDGWIATSLGGYPAKAAPANGIVADVAALKPLEAKTEKPDWYSLIGVEDAGPQATSKAVQLRGGAAVLADVLVGKESTSLGADLAGGTFVRVPGEARSWLAAGLVNMPATLGEWFDEVINIPAPDVVGVTIYEGVGKVFEARKRDGATSYSLVYVDPARSEANAAIDDTQVKVVTGGMVSVVLEDVRPASAITVGIDSRRIDFETASGLVVTATVVRGEGRPWVMFHAEASAGSSEAARAEAINARSDGWAYRIGSSKTIALLTEIGDLTAKPLPVDADGVAPGQMFFDPNQIPGLTQQPAQ